MNYSELNDTDYKRYKKLKEIFHLKYKGYELQHLIGHNIARLIYHKKLPLTKSFLRWFIVPHQKYFIPFFTSKDILISNIYSKRKDHTAFVLLIKDELECNTPLMDFNYGKKIKIVFNFINIYTSIVFIIKNLNSFNFKEAIYFGATLTYLKNYINVLEKYITNNVNIPKYVASNVTNIPESIIAMFLKKQGIKTYSIQHGIYTLYKNKIAYDIINIENMSDNILMCWGQSTIDQAQNFGIDTSKWIITGNPKYKNVEINEVKQTFKKAIVLLGRYIYNDENIELLKVIWEYKKRFEVKFEIKPHPSLNMDLYNPFLKKYDLTLIDKNILLKDLFKSGEYDFAITYNTSAYYEPLIFGIPSLRFSYHENEIYFGLNDRFQNIDELYNVIEWFKSKEETELIQHLNHTLDYVFGIKEINYNQILE